MAHLTMLELENLRHLIDGSRLAVEKLNLYAQNCRDPQLKSFIQHVASQCNHDTQKLMSFLG